MNTIKAQHPQEKTQQVSALAAAFLTVDEASEGQRVDNFLTKMLKGVPKSHVYRILRSGEVRVNKKRIDADFRLSLGDVVRIPPTRATQTAPADTIVPAVSKLFIVDGQNESAGPALLLRELAQVAVTGHAQHLEALGLNGLRQRANFPSCSKTST